jgi:hypothetical protein
MIDPEIKIKYCPTDEMVADYMTKPVVGAKFKISAIGSWMADK